MSHVELRLASHLILLEFGNVVHIVASTLLKRGLLTLPQLINYSKLSSNDVRKSLLILIKHNIVNFLARDDTAAIPTLCYEVVLFNILWKLRLPTALRIISDKYGGSCVSIVTELASHGRMSGDSILSVVSNNDQVLHELISEHYIVPINITSNLNHHGESSIMNVGCIPESYPGRYFKSEHKKPTNNALKEDPGMRLPLNRLLLCPSHWHGPAHNSGDFPQTKRRRLTERDTRANNGLVSSLTADTLYRLNPQRFNDDLRIEAWREFVFSKLGANAAKSIEILCHYALENDSSKKQHQYSRSSSILYADVTRRLPNTMGRGEFDSSLSVLSTDPLYSCVEASALEIRVLYDKLKTMTRDHVIQKTLKATLPENAYRLMGAVRAKQRLDERHLGAVALLQWNETRELLYKLFRKGYLQLQEVPKTLYDRGSRRAVFRTAYLWSFEQQQLQSRLINDHLIVNANLLESWHQEEKIFRRIVSKVEHHLVSGDHDSQIIEPVISWSELNLTSEEKQLWEKWKHGNIMIENHCADLDKVVFVLRDM